jgi:hypothetical protein
LTLLYHWHWKTDACLYGGQEYCWKAKETTDWFSHHPVIQMQTLVLGRKILGIDRETHVEMCLAEFLAQTSEGLIGRR